MSFSLLVVFAFALNLASGAAANEPKFRLGEATTPDALAAGPDGDVWFAGAHHPEGQWSEPTIAVVGRVDQAGGITEFPVPSPWEPESGSYSYARAITEGPDGAMWFVAQAAERGLVGRVTIEGTVTDWALPPGDSPATSIAKGPDGHLWVTEQAAGKVARVSTTGEVTDYGLPTGSEPVAIAAGPDGALWFTEAGSDKIGRITTDGQLEEIPIPDETSVPNQITVGPDGNIWFTEAMIYNSRFRHPKFADKIGQVTTAGTVTMFRVPARYGGTGAITPGPEGRLWFETGGEISWIAPSGQTAPPACDLCGGPVRALTSGPEGALWFGADHPEYRGGGGGALLSGDEPGFVGPYGPPRLTIGNSITVPRHGRSSMTVACDQPRRCSGVLRMRSWFGSRAWDERPLLARGRYSLAAHTSASVPMNLNSVALRLLARGRAPLAVGVEARSGTHELALRRVPLRHG